MTINPILTPELFYAVTIPVLLILAVSFSWIAFQLLKYMKREKEIN